MRGRLEKSQGEAVRGKNKRTGNPAPNLTMSKQTAESSKKSILGTFRSIQKKESQKIRDKLLKKSAGTGRRRMIIECSAFLS